MAYDDLTQQYVTPEEIKNKKSDSFDEMVKLYSEILQLILYICAENSEITENETQKKIRKVPAKIAGKTIIKDRFSEVQKNDCGKSIAVKIRNFNTNKNNNVIYISENTGKGSRKSPHSRRGHWHHYWTGSKKNNEQN